MGEIEKYFILAVVIAIIVIFLVLLLIWCFISSAVANGVENGIERILQKYTDLSDYMKEPLHPELTEQREYKPQ